MKKRIVSLLLAVLLLLGLLPAAAAEEPVSAYWPNFRGNGVNMALTDAETPKDQNTTLLKWALKLGSGWTASPSVQIIVDNALIVMSGTNLYKLDLQTGEVLQQAAMSAAPSFGYTPATYADGLIFCPLGGGTIQAFDAKTLESVWVYKDELGGQALSAITYSDGCVYTGFWNSETKDANFVCVSASDGSLKWKKTVAGGFYWAGSAAIGGSIVVGTDDGASGFSGTSHLYSLKKEDGSVISDLLLEGCGDQRSSIAYSEEKGRIYFTTKNGFLCSAAVDSASGELSDLKTVKQASQCTSTPVVYGNQVYFSCGSGVVQGSGGSGNFVIADADTLEQLCAVPLKAYPQGSVLVSEAYLEETGRLYCYSTYNGMPGGLSLIKVDPTGSAADAAELVEIYDAKGYEQYCITSPICGPDGTIYYKNDSGYVLAVGTNTAYLKGLAASAGSQKGEFSVSDPEIEWVVPAGTTGITFTPDACEGASVTVNGGAANAEIALTDGAATAVIAVTKGTDQRTYTVSVREVSSDASLGSLKVNESNAYSGAAKELTPALDAAVRFYGVYSISSGRTFVNVWPEASDANASVAVYAVSNVASGKYDAETGEIAVTAVNAGHNRYAVYFADDAQPMAIRVKVTAENGGTQEYTLVMAKEAAAEAGKQLLSALEQAAADREAAGKVVTAIDAIGTVTPESEQAIRNARAAYDALTNAQKALVSIYKTLTDAEAALEQAEADHEAAGKVVEAIDAIGTVTLESKQAIRDARAAYDALTDAQKALVSNYKTLTDAEAALEQAAADREAAGKVVEAIDAIGTVTTESEQAIRDARAAYDALTDAQKALVSNYETLTDAEAALAKLKSEGAAGTPATGGSSPVFAALMTGLFGLASAAVSFRKKQQT
ncbi:MAG: PQQ-binding-like beta-propeller repeat protein, partial [Firmicutes bacterium]|nr:PQQ-binding-like beta-propeller repeat protein [Bacillota bacterium]